MSIAELFIISLGLSMDAFAVALCKGLCVKEVKFKNMITVGLYFGIFQGIMPLIGYLLGSTFADKIQSFDHWIAFILLGLLGLNMIRESFEKKDHSICGTKKEIDEQFSFKIMLPMAIATSIDALAMGISFSILKVNILWAVLVIGIITLVVSTLGVKIGHKFGEKYRSKAEVFGGIVLMGMGVKILLEHLKILPF